MRAYKTKKWIRNGYGDVDYYCRRDDELLNSAGFKYELWFYVKIVWDYQVRIDAYNWWYIDYRNRFSLQRTIPQIIDIKKNKEIKDMIKIIKPIIL